MRFPNTLKYSKDHEWAQLAGSVATAGITDHAQSALGDIVFVELPKVGKALKKGDTFGVVESIKAHSDLYAPVSGTVLEVNAALTDNPALVNQDAHGAGWMIKIQIADSASTEGLLDAAAYSAYVDSLK